MNIVALKLLLVEKGILVAGQPLTLNTSKDAKGVKDPAWMRHWNNDKRIALSIPTEVVTAIQENKPEAQHLVLQAPETAQTEKGEFIRYRVVAVKPSEVSL